MQTNHICTGRGSIEARGAAQITGDTPEELAGPMGIDAEGLAARYERYNGYCEAGFDGEFGRDPEKLLPLATPPTANAVGVASMLHRGRP